jgi:hypothetical protein
MGATTPLRWHSTIIIHSVICTGCILLFCAVHECHVRRQKGFQISSGWSAPLPRISGSTNEKTVTSTPGLPLQDGELFKVNVGPEAACDAGTSNKGRSGNRRD